MDIAALSMGLSQMKVAQESSVSVMKMEMDTSQAGVKDSLQVLESNTKIIRKSVNQYVSGSVDISL